MFSESNPMGGFCNSHFFALFSHNTSKDFIPLRRSFNCELIDAGMYLLLLAPQVRQRTLGEVGWAYLLPAYKTYRASLTVRRNVVTKASEEAVV